VTARQVVLASANRGKQREFAALLGGAGGAGIELLLQDSLGIASVAETGTTFEANALLKARYAARLGRLPALADDSGLEVDALDGRPGVYSARYAGESAADADNNAKLLGELAGVAAADRTARYRCVLALVRYESDPSPLLASAVWEGSIAFEPAGSLGFGYDPLFIPEGLSQRAAELPTDLKNRLSHRARAAAELLRLMQQARW
jgi:XTP/dITP diphosphohydrolase